MANVIRLTGDNQKQTTYLVRAVNATDTAKNFLPVTVDSSKVQSGSSHGALVEVLEDARQTVPLWQTESQNEYFQKMADGYLSTTTIQQAESNGLIKYGPTQTTEANQEYNRLQAQSLGEPVYNDGSYDIPGPAYEIKSKAVLASNNTPGITMNQRTRVQEGARVNPYQTVKKQNTQIALTDTIGGSDLSVFMMMQVPVIEDIGKPKEIQRKRILLEEFDSALSLSYSTIRETFPVRRLGEINAIAYTRGPRTIAGHIAFAVFTEDVLSRIRSRLLNEINDINSTFKKYVAAHANSLEDAKQKYRDWVEQKYYLEKLILEPNIQLLDSLDVFSILVMGTNEAGTFTKMLIKNIRIVDENQYQGTEQPNIINKVSWVAEDIIPMHVINNDRTVAVTSINSITESYMNGAYKGTANLNTEVTGSKLLEQLARDMDKG